MPGLTTARAGNMDDFCTRPLADNVTTHFCDIGTGANLTTILKRVEPGWKLYACGPQHYGDAAVSARPSGAFRTPHGIRNISRSPTRSTTPPFNPWLTDGRAIPVAADQTTNDARTAAGVGVGIKGTGCICGLVNGDVEHRDFATPKKQRETSIILCQSGAVDPNGTLGSTYRPLGK